MPQINSCHTAVVFALGAEAGGLEDLLEGLVTIHGHGFSAKEGGLNRRRVVVVRSGAGQANAAAAAETVIAGHRPRWLISAGFAGGLDPALPRNAILLADRVGNENGDWLQLEYCTIPLREGIITGKLLMLDRVVRAPEEKIKLFEKHGAAAADMETFAAAEVCRQQNVPMLAVRIVLDAADDALPPDVERLLRQPNELARWGAALGAVFRRPGSIKDLWSLKERSLVASDKLAKFLAQMIAALPE